MNVLADEELGEFDILPPYDPKTCRIDEWWGKMDDKSEFTILKKWFVLFYLVFMAPQSRVYSM